MELYKYSYRHKHDFWSGDVTFELKLLKFFVIRETKSSYIIEYFINKRKKKVVPKKGINIFARDTEEKALNDFIIRKEKQIDILKWELNRLEELVEKLKPNKE